MKAIISAAALLVLSGCASSDYKLVFDSIPQGAMVVCGKDLVGYTPKTIYATKEKIKDGVPMSDCIAKWPSGAFARYDNVPASVVAKMPNGVQQTVHRGNEPDYAMDAQAGMSSAYQREQLDQQQAIANQQNEYQFKPNQATYCNKIGGQVFCNTY